MSDNRSILHQGQASERNVKNASAKVAFDDLDSAVSGSFQVLFPAIGGWNLFYTPKEGDHLVTLRSPNGHEEGYILAKLFTANKMPQGGAPNIFLMVSDDGKNVIQFDADNGTLDIVVDQTGNEKFKNLEVQVKENRNTEIGINDDLLIEGNQETLVVGNSEHTSSDTDIHSDAPIGLQGTNTLLGADVLQVFFDDLIAAVTRNPVIIPPIPLPKGAPVPPSPPMINMHLNGVWNDIVAACKRGKEYCAKALK
jgi:hypothetical protein